ncbi:RICIN domain-containing protein [Streptomyces chromofuscus]|uniref:Ricin-type beta-trefoil lectin domain protein n=1 Tax=Streptomyces chromofuscus TaxID=42881 RepID=A0A7M2T8G3_STRCW|nr:RICIN domain-containing protein [Streptomyces chromofuscus]QOV44409.1 ricin-type beta-trefoil lectin domain protein [Streptomyces chromofuscus]GGT22795.1 hydrolase [Streptomyces chromofuscus]
MPTPHPPRPPYPPPGGDPGESDAALAARLTGAPDVEVAHATALLTARHWQPVHDYAVICLASSGSVASMVTAAAFHQVFDRLTLGEQGDALRPRLLVTVRDVVRLWSAEERIAAALPALLKPAGGRGMRAAKSMTPENRKLAERAFAGLPAAARCLLWHTEVEAEPITFPAGLLGMDAGMATAVLEQARDKFREGCLRAHQELAPSKDCRFYNRLLDVPIRRGGALLPDVQQHLVQCRHCRDAAEQLSHFEGGLDVLLAEAVLGWGSRRYLDSRPGRTQHRARTRAAARHSARARGAARHGVLGRIPRMGGRSSRALRTGAGIAGAALLGTVLATSLSSYDGDTDPTASAGATEGTRAAPGTGTQARPTASATPPGTAQLPTAPRETRLRNAASELCLDVRDGAEARAGAVLAVCSSEATQQWSYESDGLLRSVADPGLCLDSHADAGVVILGACADAQDERADDVRYDLTVRGELLPRWDEQLALASTGGEPGADMVVKVRDGSDAQRWLVDPQPAEAGSLSVAETVDPSARQAGLGEGP